MKAPRFLGWECQLLKYPTWLKEQLPERCWGVPFRKLLEHVCVGHSRERHLQYRGGIRLWIWESLASRSLAVEAKAEITLERLPPAVLSSKRVGKLILFLGLHLSDYMLIIKTDNPFSSLPVSLGYWVRCVEMQCTFYIMSKVMKYHAVTKLCSGSCLVLPTALLPLRLSSWHSLKNLGSHDRTEMYAGPYKTSPQRSKGATLLLSSVAFNSLHLPPIPFSSLSTSHLCWPQHSITDTVFPVHPRQVSEKGPWFGGSKSLDTWPVSGCKERKSNQHQR